MNKPHIHAETIKAWADGAEIEVSTIDNPRWRPAGNKPDWISSSAYRVKPAPMELHYLEVIYGDDTTPLKHITQSKSEADKLASRLPDDARVVKRLLFREVTE